MNHPLEKLYKEANHIRLSSQERHAMRARLEQLIGASYPSVAPARPMRSLYYFMSPQFAMPMAALLVLLLGSGTAYAAEGSLPGDPLYTIKTKVSEPIQGALAFSIEDKIKFHSQVAETRIEEAEVLASENRLDATSSQVIEQSITTHIAQRDSLTSELTEQDPGSAARVSAALDTSIAAHGDVLLALGQGSTSAATREHSGAIAMQIRSSSRSSHGSNNGTPVLAMATAKMMPQAAEPKVATMSATFAAGTTSNENASISPDNSDAAMASSSSDHKKFAPAHLQINNASLVQASSSLAALRATAAKLTLDSDTRAQLDARMAKIDSLIAAGDSDDALDAIVTLSTFISASKKFDHNILGNLLGQNHGWSSAGDEGDN